MKLSKKQLKGLIREEIQRRRGRMLEAFIRRLDELHPGSDVGELLKQGIETMWKADNLFQKALGAAEDDATWKMINSLHAAMERMTFEFDAKMQKILSGAQEHNPRSKAAPPGVHSR